MKKSILLVVLLLIVNSSFAQKKQRIGYIDMEYILKNIPEYIQAQNALNTKVEKWKANLDKEKRAIEILKTDLANEKAILTEDLIEEREEDIKIKQDAFRELESRYFGANGAMYSIRKQLIKPVQDQVYNAVQTIANRGKYDFIFDKSGDLVILYSNKKYDISDLVIKLINIDQKKQDRANKIAERKKLLDKEGLSEEQKKKLAEREALKNKRIADREAKYKKIEQVRQAKLKEREEKRRLLKEKREALRKSREETKKE